MKISETIAKMYADMQKVDSKELLFITFAGITWQIQVSSLIKIFEYANKYFESKKAQS